MSAYNAAATLSDTLAALPASTLADWEALIVNDASDDATGDQLEAFAARERRVRILHNSENLGLAASLNRAIEATQGTYLARLDADDIPLPDRLARQCAFLDAHRDVGVVGMGAYIIDSAGRPRGYKAPLPTVVIPWAKLWRVPFNHPTVMLRREVLDMHGLRYDTAFCVAQDFELWSRLLSVTGGANLDRPGIRYRVHAGQATRAKVDQRLDLHRETSRRQLAEIIQTPISDGMLEAQRAYFLGEAPRGDNIPNLLDALHWRQMVTETIMLQAPRKPLEIGLGMDLWHIFRNRRQFLMCRNILGHSLPRRALAASAPHLVKQRVMTQFWKRQSRFVTT
jgi:glycosyltransferase involved in cell wall biosynthesis